MCAQNQGILMFMSEPLARLLKILASRSYAGLLVPETNLGLCTSKKWRDCPCVAWFLTVSVCQHLGLNIKNYSGCLEDAVLGFWRLGFVLTLNSEQNGRMALELQWLRSMLGLCVRRQESGSPLVHIVPLTFVVTDFTNPYECKMQTQWMHIGPYGLNAESI